MATMNLNSDTPFIVGASIGYSIAIASSVARLAHRHRRQQLWWDDAWAALALVMTVYMLVFDVLRWSRNPETFSEALNGFIGWSCFWAQTTLTWTSRISLQTTVIYFLPPGRNRTISKWAAWTLVVGWLTCGISKLFYNGLPIPIVPRRPYSSAVSGLNTALGVIATTWLVAWPCFIIMRMKLRRLVKRVLVVAFGSAIIMLITEVFHCVNIVVSAFHLLKISSHLVLAASVVMANAVILFASVYQHFNRSVDHRRDSTTSGSSDQGHSSSGGRETKMTEITSVVDPLTELGSSDLNWSEPSQDSIRSQIPAGTVGLKAVS